MYFSDITDETLQNLNILVDNFTIKLTDILISDLFRVETIITDSIYRIYPLFRTIKIISSNPNDKIFGNKLIICEKTSDDTWISFISDENERVLDYVEYGKYYSIGDSLSVDEFNSIVHLIRSNYIITSKVVVGQGTVNNDAGDFVFSIESPVNVDDGLIISNETDLNDIGTVRLNNPKYDYANYILKLKVKHITGMSLENETTNNNIIIDTVSVNLIEDTAVNIPYNTSTDYQYILLSEAELEINFNKPRIIRE